MSTQSKNHKYAGALAFLLGGACLIPVFVLDSTALVLDRYASFLARYFKLILCTNASLLFLSVGILFWMGLLVPYYSADRRQRAKLDVFCGLIGAPILVSVTVTAYAVANKEDSLFLWFIFSLSVVLIMVYAAVIFVRLKFLRSKRSEVETT